MITYKFPAQEEFKEREFLVERKSEKQINDPCTNRPVKNDQNICNKSERASKNKKTKQILSFCSVLIATAGNSVTRNQSSRPYRQEGISRKVEF